MTDAPLPTYRLDDNVAVITLDDGKANALSPAVIDSLHTHVDRALAEARAVVLAGRPGKFSAGFDLSVMRESVEAMRALVTAGAELYLRWYELGLPTVAACTGHALAGGALLLLSSDVRVGADVPCKIGLNEVAIGMPLPIFAVELARERLTRASFPRATVGAQVYDANGAAQVGYLDRVVPEAELLDAALAEARALAELPTGAYARTKFTARRAVVDYLRSSLAEDMAGLTGPSA